MEEITAPKWKKSSRCASTTCVEVAKLDERYLIIDSKNPDAAPLSFTTEEWNAFVAGVRAGEFRF